VVQSKTGKEKLAECDAAFETTLRARDFIENRIELGKPNILLQWANNIAIWEMSAAISK
jgi:hypothetical protein